MKKLIFCIFIIPSFLFFSRLNAQSSAFSISGTIKGWDNHWIYFSYKGVGRGRIWDSTRVVGGMFNFQGTIRVGANGFITTLHSRKYLDIFESNVTQRLFISPTRMVIDLEPGKFQNSNLKGSRFQDEYDQLEKSKDVLRTYSAPLQATYDSLNSVLYAPVANGKKKERDTILENRMDSLKSLLDSLSELFLYRDTAFCYEHPDSYLTAYLLKENYRRIPPDEFRRCYARFSKDLKATDIGLELKELIGLLNASAVGAYAPLFTAKDWKGVNLSLGALRGKYIILDFWESWCKPCRALNPEMIKLYTKYKGEGLEIIGIAGDDRDENAWRTAIDNDGVGIWHQILNLEIGSKYSFHSIPFRVLIDPKGIIIARYGGPEEDNENLAGRLKETFGY